MASVDDPEREATEHLCKLLHEVRELQTMQGLDNERRLGLIQQNILLTRYLEQLLSVLVRERARERMRGMVEDS